VITKWPLSKYGEPQYSPYIIPREYDERAVSLAQHTINRRQDGGAKAKLKGAQ